MVSFLGWKTYGGMRVNKKTKYFYVYIFNITMKWGNFDRSGSFVKLATVPIQECLFVASVLMEIND